MQIFVRTFGCSANTADSQAISGCLAAAGFQLTDTEADADLVIYNTCAVKGPTENRVVDALKRIPKDKKVIVAGCLPLVSFERLVREVQFNGVVGPAVGEGIVDIVQRVCSGETVTALEGSLAIKPDLELPNIRVTPVVSVVPVSYGCLGCCAYCCVVHARGHLRSCSVTEVVNRVKRDVALGAREVWLTSQDNACYGKDIGANLAGLLDAICGVEGDFRVRVGMMTPNLLQPFLDALVVAFGCGKVFKFVHLPVQSGDDGVLRRMRRFYTVKEFKEIVAAFRKAIPEISVSTDVICGFPGESAEAFENTLQLIREVQPDVVNVSKFFARPKTAAWDMRSEAVDKAEIKRRSMEAAKLARQVSFERNQRWLGWTGEILVDEKGKIEGTWVGRNFAYKPVAVRSSADLLGKTIHVKVVKTCATHLVGSAE
ncbi:MAG: tRNA (N(6)-L-threonylcarbamoyladenosine(37)-C(2))-methylthiotransferase [Candidatus Bathyarchaeota archaeon]|nr:tRNA (N(6)-L-threonylcarbamoyladenosine(37)-C(2))-methylthiotransferase [Candidatus Bathyarchaeota archaeon]